MKGRTVWDSNPLHECEGLVAIPLALRFGGAASGTRTRIEQFGRLTPNLSAIAAMLIISGCAATPTAIPIKIQVPVPCITRDQLPVAPKAAADADLLKLEDGDLVLQVAQDRLEYRRHSIEMTAIAEACIKP